MTKDDNEHEHAKDSEIVTTKSVNSVVIPEGADYGFAEVHNGEVTNHRHVMLMDWDEAGERKATKWAGNLPGITIVLRSSPGSFHAWNLTTGDLKTTACRLMLNYDDRAHVEAGIKRAYWRLRYTPKEWKYKDATYKKAPELVTVTYNETDKPQSRPHWNLAKGMYDIPDLPVSFEWEGDALTTEEYETMTDNAKERFAAENREGENDG